MTNLKISQLTAKTTPVDTDVFPMVDTPTTTTKKVTWANIKATLKAYFDTLYGYALNPSLSVTSPADATTYYGGNNFWRASNTTANVSRFYIPRSGTVKKIYLFVRNSGTAGTAETSTISFRLNNTTDTTIVSTLVTNTSGPFSNTGLSIAVTAGDYFELKWVTPTWVTNPTNIDINAVIYIE